MADKLTDAQARTLSIALTKGKVFEASTDNGRVDPLTECRWGVAYDLIAAGLLKEEQLLRSQHLTQTRAAYVLTEAGRARALRLPDKTSSASRQHWIETGRYLKYSDREEFQS